VRADIGYTFAAGLRAIVRQDPDVVMLGEIRDQETADMAIHAALTGHVVLSTLHTNDAAGAFPRLIDMQIEPFLITSSLHTVIAQRLARKLCQKCLEEVEVSSVELEEVKAEIARMTPEVRATLGKEKLKFHRGKGCDACGGKGYKGRVGVFEVLDVNEPIRDLVLKRSSGDSITEQAIKDGMVTMVQDGIVKALRGLTTLEEVWRVTRE
jgi:type IV pilus assembly protein PilB